MPGVLVVADAASVRDEVLAVLPSEEHIIELSQGRQVRDVARAENPDIAVLDLQVGSMGGVAVCMDLRLEESGGRGSHIPVLLLLDRRADVFLARRCGAEGWIVKPLDPIRLRRAIEAVRGGGSFQDPTFQPDPVLVAPR
ncbi:MAG: response regulator [Actinobacteria bacterium]|nr:response regulator [Actinomycetota bacterium]